MSWNAVDPDGVASTALQIDGSVVSHIDGPFLAASGVNFSAVYGALSAGDHAYIITATDAAGNVSTLNGTITLAGPATPVPGTGPTIGQVAVSQAKGYMSWNAVDSDGVASVGLKIDGLTVSKIGGPYAAATGGANYTGDISTLAAGSHDYVISAQDGAGNVSTLNGSFVVTSSGSNNATSTAAKSLVLGNVSQSATTTSAKVQWLYDLGGLSNSSNTDNSVSANAVDAVMAGY